MLRAHEAGRTENCTRLGELMERLGDRVVWHESLCQTEVADVGTAFRVDQDIGWLKIAVEHAFLMGLRNRPGDRREQFGSHAIRKWSGGDSICKSTAADVTAS